MSVLGARIKEKRLEFGLSQAELAEKAGYKSRSSINKIELGINDATSDKVSEFAKIFNVSPAYLMGWTDEPEDIISIRSIKNTNFPKMKKAIIKQISAFNAPIEEIAKQVNVSVDELSLLLDECTEHITARDIHTLYLLTFILNIDITPFKNPRIKASVSNALHTLEVTQDEERVLIAYRKQPDMQKSVKLLLGITESITEKPFSVAAFPTESDSHFDETEIL